MQDATNLLQELLELETQHRLHKVIQCPSTPFLALLDRLGCVSTCQLHIMYALISDYTQSCSKHRGVYMFHPPPTLAPMSQKTNLSTALIWQARQSTCNTTNHQSQWTGSHVDKRLMSVVVDLIMVVKPPLNTVQHVDKVVHMLHNKLVDNEMC